MSGEFLWCAACGERAEGNHAIHRDGFLIGPEVELCDACGSKEEPTCEELWARIAERSPNVIQLSERRRRV